MSNFYCNSGIEINIYKLVYKRKVVNFVYISMEIEHSETY